MPDIPFPLLLNPLLVSSQSFETSENGW